MKIELTVSNAEILEKINEAIEKRINEVFSNCERKFYKRIEEILPRGDMELVKQLIQEEVKVQLNGRKKTHE